MQFLCISFWQTSAEYFAKQPVAALYCTSLKQKRCKILQDALSCAFRCPAFALPSCLAVPYLAVQYSCIAVACLPSCSVALPCRGLPCLAVPCSGLACCAIFLPCPAVVLPCLAHSLPSAPSSFLASLTMHHPQHLFIPIINFTTVPTISTIWTIALDHIHMLWVICTYFQKRILLFSQKNLQKKCVNSHDKVL